MNKVEIIPCGQHWEVVNYSNKEFICSGDTYKECVEEIEAMGLEIA